MEEPSAWVGEAWAYVFYYDGSSKDHVSKANSQTSW